MANNSSPTNVLSTTSLSRYMAQSLPRDASPQLNNAFDSIALAAHASMLAVGFRLVGLGEDHRIEADSDPSNPQPLPSEWNANSGSYSFRYAHTQSSMQYLLKISRMANKAIIMGMGMGDDKTCSFDITARDYVSEGNLPATPVSEEKNQEEASRSLTDVFISAGRLSDFGSMMQLNVIQKLIPSLQKEGYEENRAGQSSRTDPQRPREPQQPIYDPLRDDRDPPARPRPLHDPLAMPPRRPIPEPMPGFEDEYETLRPPRGGVPGPGLPHYGDRDLYPQGLGPRDPMYGGVGPGLARPGGGGGMHPTFDDPLFAGQGQGGYDPRAPPGSRYDPVGPGMGGHPRGAGMGGRPPGGGPPNPFGGFGDGDFI
ncbi:uncharacterized protein LTR77_009196 [Saxophila tyrrhenica]|uniref:Proteasome inhibitor PI31 subunit n=1 Tax=Saxophila tyrrhenica TaxID=1690608 RepID=A0AAV9NYI9_9PEZI|nr:hypothetical protein LTR77_009196 [Saxophila tyrrhenica]